MDENHPVENTEVKVETAIFTAVDNLDLQWVEMKSEHEVDVLCKNIRLCANKSLKRVYLGGCMLGGSGALRVMKALKDSPARLSELDLFFNQITDADIPPILETLMAWGDAAPYFLGLAWNDITDTGAATLLPLLKWATKSSITRLSLANCLLTQDTAVLYADELVSNTRITELNLQGNTGISQATLEQIGSRLVKTVHTF
eukprot:TRINITY_DN8162_c0_g3_i1.p1 TRINITY_DN8162_c0_g3~~TRINITY_DN8162_c0_g3_i1.p1  ORF type:complete len:223 (+),score=36.93 TRINITY_DN8162_c0_g3_i1:68-670(+)